MKWELVETFTVKWRGKEWRIPMGFKTDLASIPKFFHRFFPVIDKHIQPAIVHDYFYENADKDSYKITKAEADQMFLDGMEHVGVPYWRRYAMYYAVRLGGTGIWG